MAMRIARRAGRSGGVGGLQRRLGAAVAAASIACVPVAAAATAATSAPNRAGVPGASYPTQPITVVVPFSPGGPTEALARRLAEALARALSARLIVETIGGPGGVRGAASVARARADGYTLLLHHAGHAVAPFVQRAQPYDPIADFAPIGEVAEVPMVLIGRADLPAGFAELEAWLRAQGPAARVANAGPGSASWLCAMRLAAAVEIRPTAVAFKGTSRAIDALQKGNVDLLCDQALSAVGPITGKRVRAYLVAGEARLAAVPEVPTAKEAGAGGLNAAVWYGLFAPAATPPAVLARLSTALKAALKDPALRDALEPLGARIVDPSAATPEALRARLAAEVQRWRAAWPAGPAAAR